MVHGDPAHHVAPSEAAAALDVPRLTASLQQVAAAFDQARTLGLPVSVPDTLYAACLAVVSRHDLPDGRGPAGNPGSRPSAATPGHHAARRGSGPAAAAHASPGAAIEVGAVPLRRLIWQVISPGEEFTVTDVTERIAALGASRTPSAVSNALGYWASRGRLTRERKGAYSYPQPSSPAAAVNGERAEQQEIPAAHTGRAAKARREENSNVPDAFTQGKAAS